MSGTLTWPAVDSAARAGDLDGITALLLSATEAERLAAAKPVEAGIRAADPDLWWRSDINPTTGWALAVIGCMPTAARAAALLGRRNMQMWNRTAPDRFLAVARARELPWVGDLGVRLAERLPARDVWFEDWRFAAALLRAGAAEPPATEGFVRGWLNQLLRTQRQPPSLHQRLRDDPFLDRLLPGVFEIDGLGADAGVGHLSARTGRWDTTPRFPTVIADLVAEGRLDRKVILDATVDRLARGDRVNALRPFVLLHDALALTVDEFATHTPDYARLLPDAPPVIAGLAQRALRTVDDAGRLEMRTLLEVSAATLLRTEKTLVKAQLSWLERVVRREPDRAGEILETVAAAFGHPALDIQERALTLIGRHTSRLDPGTVARLADAATGLAGDLPARSAELLGVAAPEEEPAALAELPPLPPVTTVPPPIASAAELAEEVMLLTSEETGLRWERVLAALVSLRESSHTADLATALAPLLDRYPHHFAEQIWYQQRTAYLGDAIRVVTGVRRGGGLWNRMIRALKIVWGSGRRGGADSPFEQNPEGVLSARVAEVALEISRSPVPLLLATPTHVNGSLDAEVLLDRLARLEADGRRPWPLDLQQALLRLPRPAAPDPALAERAAGLTSPAGLQFAAWLAEGGLPDPASSRMEQWVGAKSPGSSRPDRILVDLRPARTGGLLLEEQLLTLKRPRIPHHLPADGPAESDMVTMVLPHHREAVAAWALTGLASLADRDQRGGGRLLPLLAECTGPVGPAMTLALAYVLAARHEADRVAGVDAFLTLAAGPEPFAAALGTELGRLCGPDSQIKLTRVVPALTDAHRAGATAAVWQVLANALPLLLPKSPRGLPDLLELATQAARAVQARADIPELTAVASRSGSSRLFKEARRLHSILTT
ncbi:DUF7824 domain-containing protein [Actinoplanes aureus]|uniref:DUF7824 domain-containing protein n=1 Tax=Actinoplanes aureus TaxID=2792083 RepID=A0A931CE15_9ACTN|nr:DUF6493 family protein [Actinoplanes aureus]MBG0564821.1 hypothetical protein [Actinoplanes aureus]